MRHPTTWVPRPSGERCRAKRGGEGSCTPIAGDKNPQQFATGSANPLFPFTIHYSPFTFSSTPFALPLSSTASPLREPVPDRERVGRRRLAGMDSVPMPTRASDRPVFCTRAGRRSPADGFLPSRMRPRELRVAAHASARANAGSGESREGTPCENDHGLCPVPGRLDENAGRAAARSRVLTRLATERPPVFPTTSP